jgi:dehydrogenase/reductase SDR family member 1
MAACIKGGTQPLRSRGSHHGRLLVLGLIMLIMMDTATVVSSWTRQLVASRTTGSLVLYAKSHMSDAFPDKPLENCVCLVTGASRGIGKGVALELGQAGATVYVTGTSRLGNAGPEPGTVEETAQQIDALGGLGIPICCDSSKDDEITALMNEIEKRHGHLDILVNNAFRLPAGGVQQLYLKFWEQDASLWDTIHTVGLRNHFVTTAKAMKLLQNARQTKGRNRLSRPLIAMISSFGAATYTFNVAYGVGKAGVDRLVKDMAVELEDEDISVISFWPGVVNTERTERAVANGDWQKYVKLPLDQSESPRLTGRAIVAVALDPHNGKKSGSSQVVAELAEEYNFFDVNGKRPPSIRSLRFLLPTYAFNDQLRQAIPESLIPDWKLPFFIMASGKPPKPTE